MFDIQKLFEIDEISFSELGGFIRHGGTVELPGIFGPLRQCVKFRWIAKVGEPHIYAITEAGRLAHADGIKKGYRQNHLTERYMGPEWNAARRAMEEAAIALLKSCRIRLESRPMFDRQTVKIFIREDDLEKPDVFEACRYLINRSADFEIVQ